MEDLWDTTGTHHVSSGLKDVIGRHFQFASAGPLPQISLFMECGIHGVPEMDPMWLHSGHYFLGIQSQCWLFKWILAKSINMKQVYSCADTWVFVQRNMLMDPKKQIDKGCSFPLFLNTYADPRTLE